MTHDNAYMLRLFDDRPWITAPIGIGPDGQQRAMWPVAGPFEIATLRRLREVEAERDALADRLADIEGREAA